jgi:hypothetical protein
VRRRSASEAVIDARSSRSRSLPVRVSRRVSTQMIGVAMTSIASRPPTVMRWIGANSALCRAARSSAE